MTSSLTADNFDQFNNELQSAALKATKNALFLPSDIDFHRSMDPAFSKDIDAFSARLLGLTNRLLSLASTVDPNGKGKAKLESQEDVLDNFHSLIVDAMDQMLERTDICLDQLTGKAKAPAIAINPVTPKPQTKKVTRGGALEPVIQHAAHLPKPQLSFKTPVDNSDRPWYPMLTHKYNAQVPLGYHFRDTDVNSSSEPSIKHPYHYEIKHISYPARMFESSPPIPVKSFEETPFYWVSTSAELDAMLDKLRSAKEVAIDLEHHDYRTFAGFLCLMQISTREEDFIIDLLVLRDELHVLNEVFTDPKIIKVLHGAESDVVWLQQDFNLYIVNMFDTYHASKMLDFPRHGLAQLLEMYCDFIPDKRFQLADWRIRPLPNEMLHYARSDTHFLLFIYDNLRNALLDRASSRARSRSGSPSDLGRLSPSSSNPATALLRQVLTRSEETCLNLYQRELYDAEGGSGAAGWDTLARKWNKVQFFAPASLDGTVAMQREVYKAVHAWRDRVAREDDESTRYVLANHFLFKLAEEPPADMAALMRMFPSMPPVIKRRAKELLDIINSCLKTQREHTIEAPIQPAQGKTRASLETPTPSVSHNVVQNLWTTSRPVNAVASRSTLFGATLPSIQKEKPLVTFATPASSLFGNVLKNQSTVGNEAHDRFRGVIARIHNTLNVAPSISIITSPPDPLPDNEAPAAPPSEVLPMEVEIPFVPAAQRQPKAIVDDTIVLVGQRKQKKRKRTKSRVEVEEKEETISLKRTKKVNETKETVTEGFDFESVPNILDDAPVVEADHIQPVKKEKKGKKRDKGSTSQDFPAPPRAHSQLKSGNKSSTFK